MRQAANAVSRRTSASMNSPGYGFSSGSSMALGQHPIVATLETCIDETRCSSRTAGSYVRSRGYAS
jgi:hypothetical protein